MSGLEVLGRGPIRKMQVLGLEPQVQYALPLGEQALPLNEWLGRRLQLRFQGEILCLNCGRATRKSYCQGHCYPCSQRLAACDLCILKPETCKYHQGQCREPEWGEANCLQPHVVYLANTSGLKVGITRRSQIPVRWVDQGASQALPLLEVDERLHAGLVEVKLARVMADKTNWRALLKGEPEPIDLAGRAEAHLAELQWPEVELRRLPLNQEVRLRYPVLEYPQKIVSHNLDRHPVLEGTLLGIKGQYLLFDTGVINMRKYGGYCLEVLG